MAPVQHFGPSPIESIFNVFGISPAMLAWEPPNAVTRQVAADIAETDALAASRGPTGKVGIGGPTGPPTVASAANGVGYGKWHHIDGWSEAVLSYIAAFEQPLA